MAFSVHFSNRVERLRDQLFADMAVPLADPLAPEYVLVDNRVLGDWVNMQLARERGIAANIRYVQPHELFWLLARALVSHDIPRQTPLSKEEMAWKLFGLLGDNTLLGSPAMQPVRHYLAGEGSRAVGDSRELKRYQLAASVADLFDQYLVYRPDWMLQWERAAGGKVGDNGQAWQALLWQRLVASVPSPGLHHRAAIEQRLLTALQETDCAGKTGPLQRLFVFGITTMPESLVQLLAGLGQHMDVAAYIINPCREYWSLIRSARELAARHGDDAIDDQHYEIGNPLLASQGVQVRDFIALLQKYDVIEQEHYSEVEAPVSLLDAIQQDILDLTYTGDTAGQQNAKRDLPEADGNTPDCIPGIHIHDCHSAMREVEVLHQQLRDIMQRHRDIEPRDIVVMMPRVSAYAGCIHAVFNSVPEKYRIEYQIHDRSQLEESPLLNSVTTLLRLPDSRLPLSEVVSLLEVPAIQRRFGIEQADYELAKNWLVKSGIRWGVDAQHRQSLGLPAYSEASWQAGFDRLLAGYAMTNDDALATLFVVDGAECLPLDEVEGSSSRVLDALLLFWKTLLRYRTILQRPAKAGQWADTLRALVADFLEPTEDSEQLAMRVLHSAVAQFDNARDNAWCGDDIGLPVVRELMKTTLTKQGGAGHPWREGVKFCSLMPMRGVPFKVVYILGMNMEDYPRRVERRSFDLMRNHYRPGDRASRVDDRWLFLEALLSARQFFHVSYTGRDMHRNEKREPSVVLSELMDYCRQEYALPDNYLLTQHPLQPFGVDYFRREKVGLSPRLVSFSSDDLAVAAGRAMRATNQETHSERWVRSAVVADAAANTVEVDVDNFVTFFSRPWDWFLGRKYRVRLSMRNDGIEDNEALTLPDGLESWSWRSALIAQANRLPASDVGDDVRDESVERLRQQFVRQQRAAGAWPLGTVGSKAEAALQETLSSGYLLASHGCQPVPVVVSVPVGSTTLVIKGQINGVREDRYIFHSASKNKPDKLLDFYIRCALLQAGKTDSNLGANAIFFDDEETLHAEDFNPESCMALLVVLATLFLEWQESGLPFEPVLSQNLFALSEDGSKDGAEVERMEQIENAWYADTEWETGMRMNVSKRSYYGNIEALASDHFMAVSQQLCAAIAQWLSPEAAREKKAAGT